MEITFGTKEGGKPNDKLTLDRIADGVRFKYNGKVLFTISEGTRQQFIDAVEYLFECTPSSNDKN